MVMILEDLGVEKGVFLDLLHRAMNGARDACNDIHGEIIFSSGCPVTRVC